MSTPSRILIVDDNETNLFSLSKILSRLPIEIDTAISGFEALELASRQKYSLALVDIQMPVMDGFETMARLRATPGHELTPIILVSAIYTEDQYKLRGMETGAVDFIPKPVNPDILRAKVQVFLDLESNRLMLNQLINELQIKNQELRKEIRQRKTIEKELMEAKRNAERLSESKSQLLINMSHEIRTPVNSILGFADLLTNPNISNSDKEKYLRYVSSSSQNLLFLLDEILEHSRLESGEMKISVSPCSLSELALELKEAFEKIKNQINKQNIAIKLELPESTDTRLVLTDSYRLRQVWTNLISNALKYTQEGSITFGFSYLTDEIEFFVKDTGIGISKDDQAEIFNRFKRAENEASLTATGTGLGLAISKSIIELMEGRLWVESQVGKGSEFYFTLPLTTTDSVATPAHKPSSEFNLDPEWPDLTLLIAEDEELNFLFLKEALKPTRIQVLWARNGKESVEMIKTHPEIAVVLMDIKMPDMDGYEATRMIKTIKPGIPVIIQTAFALSDERSKSIREGGDDFITKPINRLLLLKTLSRFLS